MKYDGFRALAVIEYGRGIVDLPQRQPIRVIHRLGQEHRCLHTGYKTDGAGCRNRVPGQEG